MTEERAAQIRNYQENTKSVFTDYPRFEGDHAQSRRDFIEGREYVSDYAYPKLDELTDDEGIVAKKAAIQEAVMELEAAKHEPGSNLGEIELFENYHELRLKKIMLVEAARNLHRPYIVGGWEVAKDAYSELNKEVYGEYDSDAYLGMISSEYDRVQNFQPATEQAMAIKDDLLRSLGAIDTHGELETPLMDEETLSALHDVILSRYQPILEAVPATDDDIYYDADECARIIDDALEVSGLAASGWRAVVDPAKKNPSTHTAKRLIQLPVTTRRNAQELRRLILHEVEVHARRGQNGDASGLKPLKNGTADYADVEEGLGVILECAYAGDLDNPSFHRARDRYITAGLALGADGRPRDARQVYEVLWRMLAVRTAQNGAIDDVITAKAREQAYGHVENAFRGTPYWRQGVVYTKLKVYYEGLRKNADYFASDSAAMSESIDRAMIGKYNHTDPDEYESVMNALTSRPA